MSDAAQMPTFVRIGDLDGGGRGDIIVGANAFPENGATAHPASHCAADAGAATCVGAGRSYVYRGEEIAGSDPAVVLDGTGPGQTMPKIIKTIAAQFDEPFSSHRPCDRELRALADPDRRRRDLSVRWSLPVVSPATAAWAARTIVPDGKPDYVISSHRAEMPLFDPEDAYFETGVSFLFDGATRLDPLHLQRSRADSNALFGFTTGQQFAGRGPRRHAPAGRHPGGSEASNKASPVAGMCSAATSPRTTNFGFIDDPTPNTFGRFANPTEGVGDLVSGSQVGNEVLAGQFSAVRRAARPTRRSTRRS